MIRISKTQLFALIMLFEVGSTTLFALGIDAKQDSWIVILVSMLTGLILLWIYTELQKHFPRQNLAEIITTLLGKVLGGPLVIFYALYFIYISTRNLRDFGELVVTTFLPETPLIVVLIIFMLIVFYILFLGLEVLGRTAELMFPVVVFFIISTYLMITMSGQVDIKQLTPVLENGMKPVLKAAFPLVVTFPFGEMVVFLMYWCYLNSKQAIRKISFLAVSISGLILTISAIIIVSVLGVDYASISTIPLLEVIKLINIADFLTNLDAIGVAIIIIGGFFKMTIFSYGGILMLTTLFKIKDKRWMILLVGIFTIWLSIVFEPNYPFHIWLGLEVTTKYIHIPFQIIMPTLLLIIGWLKKSSNKISSTKQN